MPRTKMIESIELAIASHSAWNHRLCNAIGSGIGEIESWMIRCDNRCAFGQWLYGAMIDDETRASIPYQVVKRLHADFHRTAGEVIDLAKTGHTDRAEALLEGEFADRSEKLLRAMGKWKAELMAPAR